MVKTIITQFIKEEDKEIDFQDVDYEFSYLVKIEREVLKGKTIVKVSYRDTRTSMDYKLIHETNEKEDYKKFVKFLRKEGYYQL